VTGISPRQHMPIRTLAAAAVIPGRLFTREPIFSHTPWFGASPTTGRLG